MDARDHVSGRFAWSGTFDSGTRRLYFVVPSLFGSNQSLELFAVGQAARLGT